ncbi:MAG: hypothetical protein AUK63_805 [bacterium P3]|nr:MAG: hypothetical protein AUK63_805 [bacterium P3]KWW41873.1 MAG: hypothetical protein F083_801 [bacterium F083]
MNSIPFTNNKIVTGISRSIVIDFSNHSYRFINEKNNPPIKETESAFKESQFVSPYKIELRDYLSGAYSCIIDIKQAFFHNETDIYKLICKMPINSVQLRWRSNYDIKPFLDRLYKAHSILNIELVTDSYSNKVAKLLCKFPFHSITLLGEKKNVFNEYIPRLNYNPFEENRQTLSFYFNLQYYIEAHHTNPYFFHKIYKDDEGNIYNSPETKEIIASVCEPIEDIRKKILFYYAHTPTRFPQNKINICRHCEFRYSCMDNRIPVNKKGTIQYIEECYYNPYTMQWFGGK